MAKSGLNNKPGAAFIVSNDYVGAVNFDKLNGTHKDAERMVKVFTALGYVVVERKNLMFDKLIDFISEAADLPYTPSYKRLVFVFSGHGVIGERLIDKQGRWRGNAGGKVCSQEGHEIEIESIIDQFKPDKHPALGRMARLFFFDVCRGTEEDKGVPLQTRGMSERGGQFLAPERVPKHGNILVAYSTLPNHKAYELGSGSLWIEFLTKAILTQEDDITAILTDVSGRIEKVFQSFDVFQTPQYISQLTERVNFLRESRELPVSSHSGQTGNSATASATKTQPCIPSQTRAPVCSPPSVMKTPIAKLQEYCQQNNLTLPVYKELQVVGGFRWIVTIRDKQYGGGIKSSKQDAKHSVAEVALRQLDGLNLANRGGSSVSSVKQLKEKYFDKKQIMFKKDNHFKTNPIDGRYQCTLCIDGKVFTSSKYQSKSDAENGAAKQALKHFNLS